MKKIIQKYMKGFTIVELVIVIAVVAVLAAVLVPTFSGIVDKANDSKALQEARNMYTEYISEGENISKAEGYFIVEVKENAQYVTVEKGNMGDVVHKTLDEAKSALPGEVDYILIKNDGTTSGGNTPEQPDQGGNGENNGGETPEPETPVSVTGVTLNNTSLNLTVGGTATLTATVAPDDATNKAVTWTVAPEDVVTVNNGNVTALAEGTATITVTTTDGSKTAVCTVNVAPQPLSISYELNGGSFDYLTDDLFTDVANKLYTFTYNNNPQCAALPIPVKDGYAFRGWYANSDFSGDKVEYLDLSTAYGHKTFYAQWVSTSSALNAELADLKTKLQNVSQNSISFIAASDTHEFAVEDYVTGNADVKNSAYEANANAGYAAELIANDLKPSFLALLGDFTWGGHETTINGGSAAIARIMQYYKTASTKVDTTFITAGNHDNLMSTKNESDYLDMNEIGSLIGDITYGSKVIGNVRIITLNTSDTTGINADQDTSGYINIGAGQLAWFKAQLIEAGTAGQSIIILSHVPLDWNDNRLTPTLNAVKDYVAGNGDFAGKNNGQIIANFHGHVHAYNYTNYLAGTYIPRIAIPNASYTRNNEYGRENKNYVHGDSVTYPENDKKAGEATKTALCYVVIDFDAQKIYAYTYGYSPVTEFETRIVSYDKSRTVTVNASNASVNAPASVELGKSYSWTVTANEGYMVTDVTVTMNGADVTDAYTDGSINITSVTGDIAITVTTVEKKNNVSVTQNLTNATSTFAQNVTVEGESFETTIAATSGNEVYLVKVTMDGTDITSTVYTKATGKITIGDVTGNIAITVKAGVNQLTSSTNKDPIKYVNEVPYDMVSVDNYNKGYRIGGYVSTSQFAASGAGSQNLVTCYFTNPFSNAGGEHNTIIITGLKNLNDNGWRQDKTRFMFFRSFNGEKPYDGTFSDKKYLHVGSTNVDSSATGSLNYYFDIEVDQVNNLLILKMKSQFSGKVSVSDLKACEYFRFSLASNYFTESDVRVFFE